MFEELLKGSDWKSLAVVFEKGRVIFSEGDEGGDLYILVSGEVEILKGDKVIASIAQEGAVFGEMASLLSKRRTATVKAATRVEVVRIPLEDVGSFLLAHPQASAVIARNLAARLDETGRIIYALREICDQLPDAVVLTDAECRILVWNRAAEEILGRRWEEIKNMRFYEVFLEPLGAKTAFLQFGAGAPPGNITLSLDHPQKGKRIISLAVKPVFDGSGTFHGLLSSARDVTGLLEASSSKKRSRKAAAILLVCAFLAAAGGTFSYVFFVERNTARSSQAMELQRRLNRDYNFLASLLRDAVKGTDSQKAGTILRSFLAAQEKEGRPYRTVILLDGERKVIAHAGSGGAGDVRVETYGGIAFDHKNSAHSVVSLYRVTAEKPMGEKTLEAAFLLKDQGKNIGWIVFDMDIEMLEKRYGITAEALKAMRFKDAED